MTRAPVRQPSYRRPDGVDRAAILRVFRVPPESAGMRCDVFIQSQLRNTSRTRARAIVENSAFSVEGKRLRPSERLHAEAFVLLWRPPFTEPAAPDILPIVYDDEHLLVVNKPAPMTVHPTARHYHHTVIKTLEQQLPGETLRLVHRLDRDTSGALLIARSEQADRAFKVLLEQRSRESARGLAEDREVQPADPVQKTYVALTHGVPESKLIDLPLENDDESPLRVKMRIAAPGRGLPSRTSVETIDARSGFAMVRCQLHTGRQHQIRVHLAALGCPLVGDKLYGPDEQLLARAADNELTEDDLAQLILPRHALHAERYRLRHAMTGQALDLFAPLAPDLAQFWQSLAR